MSQHIEVKNLTKSYTVGDTVLRAVDGVSLSIARGELLSVVGHSGSGKTTLVSMIGGILRPTSGEILFNGTNICGLDDRGLSEHRSRKVGFIFQFASLLPILTAEENIRLPGLFGPERCLSDSRRARELLELVGLGEKTGAYPAQLSGGQQRRVAIARALINSPELILADEPTGDLDEETEREILGLFRNINEEKKVTIILITHNLELARQAKRRLRMSKGVLVEER